MSSNIRVTRRCQFCGKSFIAKTTVTKNCSDYCAKRTYKLKLKEKKVQSSELDSASVFKVAKGNLSEKPYLSIDEAATLFGVSSRTLKRMVANKKLPVLRFFRRIILVKEEVETILKNR
ncbi:helix-turn-helix domain-containing protein [Rufibacter glacialis]|uniref:Helix-turn-helix domain-containing protein n=1 Tax=Rufibacter glacialis TaxID=1259555 RepID=A0A5M8QAE1_9BACT|nr:helix-turn-helix domain-containing protein [Rufibacter glacialis]